MGSRCSRVLGACGVLAAYQRARLWVRAFLIEQIDIRAAQTAVDMRWNACRVLFQHGVGCDGTGVVDVRVEFVQMGCARRNDLLRRQFLTFDLVNLVAGRTENRTGRVWFETHK